MAKTDGGPAFPVPQATDPHTGNITQYPENGMTLRDWFAGQALAGFTANQKWLDIATKRARGKPMNDILAAVSYGIADALLARRSK